MTLTPEEFAVARRQIEERERARISSEAARDIVEEFLRLVYDTSPRIETAGSLRRLDDMGAMRAGMHDVELVAEAGMLFPRLDRLVIEGTIEKSYYIDKNERITTRWGPRYRGVHFRGLRLEIFLTTPDDWGYQFWLRTGPADANHHVMGWLSNKALGFRGGSGWYTFPEGELRLRIPDEDTLFALLGLPYQRPGLRTLDWYKKHLRLLPGAEKYRPHCLHVLREDEPERAVQRPLF